MSFILNRKQRHKHIDKVSFYKSDDKMFLFTFNNTILNIYDPVNLILTKNLFRPIIQILALKNKLLVCFEGGDISVVRFIDEKELVLDGLIFEEDVSGCTFMRKMSENGVLVFYGPFKFKIVYFDKNNDFLQQENSINTVYKSEKTREKSSNINNLFKSFTEPKSGVFSFHSISPTINNITDILVFKNFLYVLYCPNHCVMTLTIIDLTNLKVVRNFEDIKGKKLIQHGNHVVSVGEALNFFLFQDLVFTLELKITFNVLNSININNNLVLFTESQIYNLEIEKESFAIRKINILKTHAFYGYSNIIYAIQEKNYFFIKSSSGTCALFQQKIIKNVGVFREIGYGELNKSIDLLKTRVVFGNNTYNDTQIHGPTLVGVEKLKEFISPGIPTYNLKTGNEQFTVTDKLIRRNENYKIKFTKIVGSVEQLKSFEKVIKFKEFMFFVNDKTHLFRIENDCLIHLVEGETQFILNEKTILVSQYKDLVIQITDKRIYILDHQSHKIQIDGAYINNNYLFIKQNSDLIFFDLEKLVCFTPTIANRNNKLIFVDRNICCFLYFTDFYKIEIIINDLKVFTCEMTDLLTRFENGSLKTDTELTIDIDQIIVYKKNNYINLLIRCNNMISLYRGLSENQSCKSLTKINVIYSEKMINSVDYILLDSQRILIKETNTILKVDTTIETVVFEYFLTDENYNQTPSENVLNQKNENEEFYFAVCDKKIIKVEREKNPIDYIQKTHKIKNIDKLVHDIKNNVFIFTFLPKSNLKSDLFYFNGRMTKKEIQYANERQEIILASSNFNKLSSYLLPHNEYVHCLEILSLSDQNNDLSEFVILGLSERCSDEILKGRIVVFEVIDVVSSTKKKNSTPEKDDLEKKPDQNDKIPGENSSNRNNRMNSETKKPPIIDSKGTKSQKIITKTKKALKILASEATKGTIQEISSVRGKIAVILTTRLMVYEFDRNEGIQAIAFHDLYMLTTGLDVIKNYIVVSDLNMGICLLYFQSEPVKIHLLARSDKIKGLIDCSTIYCNNELYILCLDSTGTLLIYTYSAHNILSNKGELLICRQSIKTFQRYYKTRQNKNIENKKILPETKDKLVKQRTLENLKISADDKIEKKYTKHKERKNAAFFFSDQQFELSIYSTSLDTTQLEEVLAHYKTVKDSLGVNLLDSREEITFKPVIDMEMVKEFVCEGVNQQKQICAHVGVKYNIVMEIIQELQIQESEICSI